MMRRFLLLPVRDFVAVVDAMTAHGVASWLALATAFVATWFVYVPVHELLHAAGCIVAGGTVSRLEIAPEYGGSLLASVFPFVASGSRYAGQLTGFDTQGSDAVYLATVLAPYVLTIMPGVPLLERAIRADGDGRRGSPWLVGIALPLAWAPFASIAGDYYEAGSILVTRGAGIVLSAPPLARLRGDDLVALISTLHRDGASPAEWAIVAASTAAGLLLALVTYHLGALVGRALATRAGTATLPEKAP
jgi:hypothetical protein